MYGLIGSVWLSFYRNTDIILFTAKSAFINLFSFHRNKHNQTDFWLSTDSRHQKNIEYDLLYALEPLSKIGKGTLTIFKPFRNTLDALTYTGGILAQTLKGVGNIIAASGKSLLGAPLLLGAGLGQAMAAGSWPIAKEAIKRSSLLFIRGVAQAGFGVFQLGAI